MYDSKKDTKKHIKRVQELIQSIRKDLDARSMFHDESKLSMFEKPYFDEATPKLKTLTYGSDEYKAALRELRVALTHHYQDNDHHPEFFYLGEFFGEDYDEKIRAAELVTQMNLVQIMEMLCDWKAASERHANGDIRSSIEINANRFNFSDELKTILLNTVDHLGW